MTRDDFPNWDQTDAGSLTWLRWWCSWMDEPALPDLCHWCSLVRR